MDFFQWMLDFLVIEWIEERSKKEDEDDIQEEKSG